MGTGIGGSSTTGAFRFADPDVRRHGGTRIFEKLESGVYRRSQPVHQPWESTQSQFRSSRFQDPAIAPIISKNRASQEPCQEESLALRNPSPRSRTETIPLQPHYLRNQPKQR